VNAIRVLRSILLGALLVISVLLPLAAPAQRSVRVKGYVRKDGTYVAPHYRSARDSNFWNNWSTYGNINPYTLEWGTRRTPPASGITYGGYGSSLDSTAYRSPYRSSYDVDLELIRLQNEVRLATIRRDEEMRRLQDQLDELDRRARRAEFDLELARLTSERDRRQDDLLLSLSRPTVSSSTPSGYSARTAPSKAPYAAPVKLSHQLYVVNRFYSVDFEKPVTSQEASQIAPELLKSMFPDRHKQYERHVNASERALDARDYSGFQRSFDLAKGIMQGREWAYIKPSITFKRIRDGRTLIVDSESYGRFGRMTTDAYIRSKPEDDARRYARAYDLEPLVVVRSPKKDWLGVLLVNGSIGYVKTNEVEVSAYVFFRK